MTNKVEIIDYDGDLKVCNATPHPINIKIGEVIYKIPVNNETVIRAVELSEYHGKYKDILLYSKEYGILNEDSIKIINKIINEYNIILVGVNSAHSIIKSVKKGLIDERCLDKIYSMTRFKGFNNENGYRDKYCFGIYPIKNLK